MHPRYAVLASLLVLPLVVGGCSKSSSRRGFSSTAAGVNSSTPSATTSSATTSGTTSGASASTPPGAAGPLTRKAQAFQAVMQAWHLGHGQVQNIRLDTSGNVVRTGNAPSRLLWTGFYAATQAMRYRQTNDPQALQQMEAAVSTLHDLYEVTGTPGIIARGYDLPSIETNGWPAGGRFAGFNYNKGSASRDQYAGWFFGVAHCFDLIQDPALKQSIRDDVRAVCDNLITNDLKLTAPWGPQGTVEVFFDLNPGGGYSGTITAQNWAKVDDFPLNLITKSVPFSQPLADAIQRANLPPIRAGEALRALFFFTVAEHVTGDAKYANYKRDLLFGSKDFFGVLRDYSTILDDLLHGRNLPVVEAMLRQLLTAIGGIVQAYLVATGQSAIVTQLLLPVASAGISAWLSQALTDALAWLHAPNSQAKLAQLVQRARMGVMILNLVGQGSLATKVDDLLNRYGANLNSQGLKDFARTVRSHLGVNLSLMPLSALVRMETDPQVVALYRGSIDQRWDYYQGDHNPMVNLIHAGYGGGAGPNDLAHTREALTRYPVDMAPREIDNSSWPGLVRSPWPDRFGRVGQHALVPDYFPIDKRSPDIFPWRGHPRAIKSGSNSPTTRVAPLGYLAPYWFARDLGFVTHSD
jgi:hypothetical protein